MDNNIKTFNKESSDYNFARPVYPGELYAFLATTVVHNDCAWDCACGTGQVSRSLTAYFKEVKATDISENQIEHAQKHEKIEYSLQPSEKTNFADDTFDLICVAQALHWFDFDSFFKEAKRVLKKNGVFACWGYSFFSINSEIDAVIEKTILEPLRPYWSQRNHILWNGYKDVAIPFKEIPAPKFEMIQNWNKKELVQYIKTWSAYKRFIEHGNEDILANFLDISEEIWPHSLKKHVVMDFTFYAGRYV